MAAASLNVSDGTVDFWDLRVPAVRKKSTKFDSNISFQINSFSLDSLRKLKKKEDLYKLLFDSGILHLLILIISFQFKHLDNK